MSFIKKVFDKKSDDFAHLQFQKFSRGEFPNKALVKIKNSSGKYTISTTAEFANELVLGLAEKIENEKVKVTGGIISTLNLKEIPMYKKLLENSKVKQFQGVKNYSIDMEMSGKEIADIVKAFPKAFFALSFNNKDSILKIKPKAPKSAKPKNKDEEPTPNFCKLVTNDLDIVKSFFWEKPDFKEVEINHTFIIDSIIIPDSLKNEKDFSIIREKSLRKGRITRKIKVDNQEMKNEVEFEA